MPLRDDLLNPIPGDNPSGESLRYAPIYDQIKEARREEEDVEQGAWQHEIKKADWVLVVKLCSEALAKKSKDLQVAAWLTEAHLRREGFSGLREGLDLMRSLCENFWDTLYPEIEDGDLEMRGTPLEWVGSRLDAPIKAVAVTKSGLTWVNYKDSRGVPYETDAAKAEQRAQAVADGKLTPEEFDLAVDASPKAFYEQRMESLEACLASTDALTQFCDEKFGDYSPNFGALKKSLEEIRQLIHVLLTKKRQQEPDEGAPAEEAVEEAPAETYETADSGAAAPVRAKPARKGTLAAEPADRDDAIERVAVVARWFRQNDAYSPVPYLLVRGLRFGELRAAGSEPDWSVLEAPPSETRQEIKRLYSEGNYAEALEAAEKAAATPAGRAWLDVHRYAALSCESLGYSAPAAAIAAEVRCLLADYPNLPERTLADDTPTASPDTREWIKGLGALAAAGSAPATDWYTPPPPEPEAAQAEEGGAEHPRDAYEIAMDALRAGDSRQAIEILTVEAVKAGSGRARFQRKVQLAQICLGSGKASIAGPILEELAEEIDRHKLEDWEAPETVAHALGLLYRSMQSAETPAEIRHKIYARICRLDPVQALKLSS